MISCFVIVEIPFYQVSTGGRRLTATGRRLRERCAGKEVMSAVALQCRKRGFGGVKKGGFWGKWGNLRGNGFEGVLRGKELSK